MIKIIIFILVLSSTAMVAIANPGDQGNDVRIFSIDPNNGIIYCDAPDTDAAWPCNPDQLRRFGYPENANDLPGMELSKGRDYVISHSRGVLPQQPK